MSTGVMTFRVIDATKHELLDRLTKSIIKKERAVFLAKSLDDASKTPKRHIFEVRVESLSTDIGSVVINLIDQHDRWFQVVLDIEAEMIDFEIIIPT